MLPVHLVDTVPAQCILVSGLDVFHLPNGGTDAVGCRRAPRRSAADPVVVRHNPEMRRDGLRCCESDGVHRTAEGHEIMNEVLGRFLASVAEHPVRARAELEQALTAAAGPLVQRIGGTDQVVVTFVVIGRTSRPYVLCALFDDETVPVGMALAPQTSDVWWVEVQARSDVTTTYQYLDAPIQFRNDDVAQLHNADAMRTYIFGRYQASFADPFNPVRRFPAVYLDECELDGDGPRKDKWDPLLALPDTPAYPWHTPVAERGLLHARTVHSELLGNTRSVTIWTPPGHDANYDDHHTVVLFDGEDYASETFRADLIFDNLVTGGHVPPFVAVLVGNASAFSRSQELPCNPAMAAFVADELLPSLRKEFGIAHDPARIAVGGFSYGALAANWLAFTRPDVFGNVLSMSASLWWGKREVDADPSDPSLGRDDQPEWLTRQYESVPVKPIRHWLDVGILENQSLPFAGEVTQLSANRHFREVLADKGYDVAGYLEQAGAHDFDNWRRTLPMGMIALFGEPHFVWRNEVGK